MANMLEQLRGAEIAARHALKENLNAIREIESHRDDIAKLYRKSIITNSQYQSMKAAIGSHVNGLYNGRADLKANLQKAVVAWHDYQRNEMKDELLARDAAVAKIMKKLSKADIAFLKANTHLFK